jgi:hypothetical protein
VRSATLRSRCARIACTPDISSWKSLRFATPLDRRDPRTLERWEQGRSKPNEQAVLLWLVRKYPDTLERLESLGVPA